MGRKPMTVQVWLRMSLPADSQYDVRGWAPICRWSSRGLWPDVASAETVYALPERMDVIALRDGIQRRMA
jgi:hypothetical protein